MNLINLESPSLNFSIKCWILTHYLDIIFDKQSNAGNRFHFVHHIQIIFRVSQLKQSFLRTISAFTFKQMTVHVSTDYYRRLSTPFHRGSTKEASGSLYTKLTFLFSQKKINKPLLPPLLLKSSPIPPSTTVKVLGLRFH